MDKKTKLEQNVREKGEKADIFFDSIDYSILALTQDSFKSREEICEGLNIALKNLNPHIKKLVKIGLLDGVKDVETKTWVFSCYYKLSGDANNFGFLPETRNVFEFLEHINQAIQSEKVESDLDEVESVGRPEIKKK